MGAESKSRVTPSNEEIYAAFKHTLYEIEMFVGAPKVACNNVVVSSALTESYLLHARILCEFFQKDPIRDDISCQHYGFEKDCLGVPDELETRFDKCLAHLTYTRLKHEDEDTKQWIHDAFRPQILKRSHQFLTHVLEAFGERMDPELVDRTKRCCEQINLEVAVHL